ncbi:DUF3737 family protein [Breznakia pachnodae]|uniref:Hydrogenase n=1 Tax=Breznakia pachnodae TaxID=265178 RepID=A0ABU0E2M8_9FIRM|nr:DUF3737 family protein [Breznakia pachnodae]MDQ0361065.1 hypothetical protein [Breznakia pachnodae]
MKLIRQELLSGERALFNSNDLEIVDTTFEEGESPLKESTNIILKDSVFKWKYPLWYCDVIKVSNTALLETARSGIWYTNKIEINDSIIDAPKTFRRSNDIVLNNVLLTNADETLWNCKDIKLNKVNAKGNYFGMNSKDVYVDNLQLSGDYAFDGVSNIEVHNSKLLSKDAFWNCENVKVYNSVIIGEYLGWNSKNVTFVNCTIESLQGLCYIENLVLENCKILNSELLFEYTTANAEVITVIDSVKNPSGGIIQAKGIDELILDDTKIDVSKTTFVLEETA